MRAACVLSCSVVSDSLRLPWTVVYQAPLSVDFFPGKNIGVGSHFLLQGIFLTQGSNRISCCCSVAHHVQLIVTPWTAACQVSLSFSISQSFLKLMSTELVIPFNHLILCCPLLLPSIFPSIRVFSNESAFCIRWPKYWSFNFSIQWIFQWIFKIDFL